MSGFLQKLKNILSHQPYLTFAAFLTFFVLSNQSLHRFLNTDKIEPPLLSIAVAVLLIILYAWVQTRLYKFYLTENRKWFFDKGDIKAIFFFIIVILTFETSYYFIELALNTWHGDSTQIESSTFLDKYGKFIYSIICLSILLKFLALYPLGLIAGNPLKLSESIKKLGNYALILITVALIAAYIEFLRQYAAPQRGVAILLNIAKALVSTLSLVCAITIYKIRVGHSNTKA